MTTRLLAVIFMLFSMPAFAQVQAPDYMDNSKWEFHFCDESLRTNGKDYLLFHEEFYPVGNVFPIRVTVVYKQRHINEVKTFLDRLISDVDTEAAANKLVSFFQEQPWLLIYPVEESSIHLFEWKDEKWNFEVTFKGEKEFLRYLADKYGLK